uniref:Uncharacterized protein n=1 Tax=Oryza meridionalis TaxID=40149 RepID=A0A0E0DNI9_9ORYZ
MARVFAWLWMASRRRIDTGVEGVMWRASIGWTAAARARVSTSTQWRGGARRAAWTQLTRAASAADGERGREGVWTRSIGAHTGGEVTIGHKASPEHVSAADGMDGDNVDPSVDIATGRRLTRGRRSSCGARDLMAGTNPWPVWCGRRTGARCGSAQERVAVRYDSSGAAYSMRRSGAAHGSGRRGGAQCLAVYRTVLARLGIVPSRWRACTASRRRKGGRGRRLRLQEGKGLLGRKNRLGLAERMVAQL